MIDARVYRRILLGCAFLAAYVALDYVSYVKPYRGLGITPWNPPPGLSIAAVFLGGWFYAPFVLIAPAVADLLIRGAALGAKLELILSLAIGSTYLAGGLALQRIATFDPRFRFVRDAITMIGVAVSTALVASALYVVILLYSGTIFQTEVVAVAWRAAVGDIIGILVVAPLVFMAVTYRPWPKPDALAFVQLLAIFGTLAIVFGYQDATAFQLFYLLFLPLLWIALRYGPPGAAVALLLIQIGLIIGAEIRFGPDPGLGALQVLMIALAITGLIVSTIVAEREDTAARLRDQQASINRALRIRSAGEVAATIAHEINQPLTALSTYAGIAAKAMEDGRFDLVTRAVAKIKAESVRANEVLQGIRELLRQGTLTKRTIDLRSKLEELEMLLGEDLEKKGIRLVMLVEPDFPLLKADGVQLQQAVHNLIVNSAEAILEVGRGGTIVVNVAATGDDDARIEVQDDGPGFPPGFDVNEPAPFTTTKPEGSGLGLAVARSIAEAHGGNLTIVTSSRGSRVAMKLPIEREADEQDR
ncbi:ATP-binding protein [Hyphomicrobium sp.]|uniref:ATP-binding protein n=1 Tax=Hyphomicrobium sp. TaxID=82 RepID=UPI002E3504B8|nr:MASE1 domain-containing protein [Hyphomicrobium sp.]HEX2839994.1 MASE1 domain-containing protein [Hyphomicrobium sp.]